MYLVADSGATKCDWALVTESGVQRLRTRGLNPAVQEAAYMRRVLASELGADAAPEAVWFYGAGCSTRFPEATALMRTLLGERFPSARLGVESDLLGAARALFADGGGIACILGTGSNSGWYDGRGIVGNVPPLGYVLGDEGSGAAIGRELLRGVLRETLSPELCALFYRRTGLDYERIVGEVYRGEAPSRFLASLVPFAAEHIGRAEIRSLVRGVFDDFAAHVLSRYPSTLPVAAAGGVAAGFGELLREALAAHGRRVAAIVRAPLDGLIAYHETRR